MKQPFHNTSFVSGTSAFVEKNGTEYEVKFGGTTNLTKYPSTAIVDGADYVMVSNSGVLNTGEQLYMKAKPQQTCTPSTGYGKVKGYTNVYLTESGALVFGTQKHKTAENAITASKKAKQTIVAAGIPITW